MKNHSKLINNNERLTKFNASIIFESQKNKTINEIYDYISILKSYFGFNELIEAEIKWILKITWTDGKYKEYYNGCFYESVCLAATVHVHDRYKLKLNCDILEFIELDFKPENQHIIIDQANWAWVNLKSMFNPEIVIESIEPIVHKY